MQYNHRTIQLRRGDTIFIVLNKTTVEKYDDYFPRYPQNYCRILPIPMAR